MAKNPLEGAQDHVYKGGRILAIDFGTKNIGLATCLPNMDPYPLPYGRIANDTKVFDQIIRIVNDEDIQNIVVGLPYLTDGKATEMTTMAHQFGQKVAAKLPALPLFYQDETLSSFEAEERMKKDPRYGFKIIKEEIDALAAAILIEDFLQKHRVSR